MNFTSPLIFLLDMDHTIIGESYLQVCRYELYDTMKYKADPKQLFYEFDVGLLRPHFVSFIKLVNSKYPNAEFFIYTAAEKKWAAHMISNIERYMGIKFNRPIFSRQSCVISNNTVYKSIGKIVPVIFKKLKEKYTLNNINDLKKQIVLIDNNKVITDADAYRFIQCPSYEFIVASDVLTGIPEFKLQANITSLITILTRYNMFYSIKNITKDYHRVVSHYYIVLSELYKTCGSLDNKSKHENDKFWLNMERIFRNHNIKSFNHKVVRYINKNKT